MTPNGALRRIHETPRWLALLAIAKPTWWFVWMVPFTYGYLSRPEPTSYLVILFMMFWAAYSEGMACLVNERSDQVEDNINFPERARLLHIVGLPLIRKLTGWPVHITAFVINVTCVYLWGGTAPLLMLVLGLLPALTYDMGLRLKHRGVLAEVSMGWAFLCLFWAGYVWDAPLRWPPPILFLGLAFWILTNFIKDLPDYVGDAAAGRANVFASYAQSTVIRRMVYAGLLFFSPYLLVGAMVGLGVLPDRFVWLYLLLPFAALLWLHTVFGNMKDGEGPVVYQQTFTYMHLAVLLALILWTPGLDAVLIGAILFVSRLVLVWLRLDPRLIVAFDWGTFWQTWRSLTRRSGSMLLHMQRAVPSSGPTRTTPQ